LSFFAEKLSSSTENGNAPTPASVTVVEKPVDPPKVTEVKKKVDLYDIAVAHDTSKGWCIVRL